MHNDDQDLVMSMVLNGKMCKIPGSNKHLIRKLVALFKDKYQWLTVSKLNKLLCDYHVDEQFVKETTLREKISLVLQSIIVRFKSNNFMTPGMYSMLL